MYPQTPCICGCYYFLSDGSYNWCQYPLHLRLFPMDGFRDRPCRVSARRDVACLALSTMYGLGHGRRGISGRGDVPMRSLQVMAFEQLLVRNAVNGFVEYPRRLHGDRLVMGEGLCVGNACTR